MNITLVTVGLLLIASAITLMAAGPRTWLVAMAHGLGMQAAVGIVASAVQVAWFRDGADMLPVEQRVVLAVEGIPFNTAGWTAASAFERLSLDQHEGRDGRARRVPRDRRRADARCCRPHRGPQAAR
jgi:hypothetical protein